MFNHESTGATSSTLLGKESSDAMTEIDRASGKMHRFSPAVLGGLAPFAHASEAQSRQPCAAESAALRNERHCMRWFLNASFLAMVAAGCGGRSTMESCAQGSVDCQCYPSSTCSLGLLCVSGKCVDGTSLGGSGGATGDGGSLGSGGAPTTTRPLPGVGGMAATGGVPTGGAGATVTNTSGLPTGGIAGAVASGGTSGGGGTAFTTLVAGRAQGAMSGYGWVAMGALDSVTSPTCDGRPITSASQCTGAINWATGSNLCITGFVPALPTNPSAADYSDNWGILFAVETTEPPGGGLGVSYRTATFILAGSPSTGLRATVHRKGDPEGTNYCAFITAGISVPFTLFNTACWDGTGAWLSLSDVPNLDWIGIQVSSVVATPIKVANLCLNAIIFGQ